MRTTWTASLRIPMPRLVFGRPHGAGVVPMFAVFYAGVLISVSVGFAVFGDSRRCP